MPTLTTLQAELAALGILTAVLIGIAVALATWDR